MFFWPDDPHLAMYFTFDQISPLRKLDMQSLNIVDDWVYQAAIDHTKNYISQYVSPPPLPQLHALEGSRD